jgi:hypothetical protein
MIANPQIIVPIIAKIYAIKYKVLYHLDFDELLVD